jgi:hypothetical protein
MEGIMWCGFLNQMKRAETVGFRDKEPGRGECNEKRPGDHKARLAVGDGLPAGSRNKRQRRFGDTRKMP